jgi:hypothetical protein
VEDGKYPKLYTVNVGDSYEIHKQLQTDRKNYFKQTVYYDTSAVYECCVILYDGYGRNLVYK